MVLVKLTTPKRPHDVVNLISKIFARISRSGFSSVLEVNADLSKARERAALDHDVALNRFSRWHRDQTKFIDLPVDI